ncbi:MAG: SDR family oxidoreductase [Acidobacteria bacterium]|nr:SDR family oxidoreductase [Acidobacteriota bacterium]
MRRAPGARRLRHAKTLSAFAIAAGHGDTRQFPTPNSAAPNWELACWDLDVVIVSVARESVEDRLTAVDLTDRVALITGGRRIGAVVATELARRGADVALVYRTSGAEAEETAEAVRDAGRRAIVLRADLTAAEACERVVADTVGELGRLDVLVNMASRYQQKPFEDLTVADWDEQLAVDLRAAWLCARAAVPHMRRVRGGRIINFADWVAASGRPLYLGYVPYYVAKAGVVALTEALALELASDQILVNAIAPGPIVAPEGTTDEEFARVERATPLGRWGGELEIAKAVVALIKTDFITGETVRVDGGRHLK